MATKGIKITDAYTDPTGGADLTATFVKVYKAENQPVQGTNDLTVNIVALVYRDMAAYDASKQYMDSMNYSLAITEAEWDANTVSPNELFYDKLDIEIKKTYPNTVKITK